MAPVASEATSIESRVQKRQARILEMLRDPLQCEITSDRAEAWAQRLEGMIPGFQHPASVVEGLRADVDRHYADFSGGYHKEGRHYLINLSMELRLLRDDYYRL